MLTCPTQWNLPRAEQVRACVPPNSPQRLDNMRAVFETVLQQKIEEMKPDVEKELAEMKDDMATVKSAGKETIKDFAELKKYMHYIVTTVRSASEETRKDVAELKMDIVRVQRAGEETRQGVAELLKHRKQEQAERLEKEDQAKRLEEKAQAERERLEKQLEKERADGSRSSISGFLSPYFDCCLSRQGAAGEQDHTEVEKAVSRNHTVESSVDARLDSMDAGPLAMKGELGEQLRGE